LGSPSTGSLEGSQLMFASVLMERALSCAIAVVTRW
jgi:hypothetical protein